MQNFSRAGLIILFVALVSNTWGASPTGVVRDANGDVATIEATGDVVPSVGDKVEIFFQLAGTDTEVAVATGHVQAVAATKITVKIDNSSGIVEANQLARFTVNTSRTAAVTPPPAPAVSTPNPKGLLPPSTETPIPKFQPSPSTKSSPPSSKKSQTPPPPKVPRQPPPPQQPEPDDAVPGALYAAVAFSPSTGKSGWSSNYPSKNQAIARARSECGGQSDATATWCRNAWVALAISDKKPGGFGSAWGSTASAAKSLARKECLKRNPDARIISCVSSSSGKQ